jgi:hypothetical protein
MIILTLENEDSDGNLLRTETQTYNFATYRSDTRTFATPYG